MPALPCLQHFGADSSCSAGDRCEKSHDRDALSNLDCPFHTRPTGCSLRGRCPMRHNGGPVPACLHHFSPEGCRHGDKCHNSHNYEAVRRMLCPYFHGSPSKKSVCKLGSQCPMRHDDSVRERNLELYRESAEGIRARRTPCAVFFGNGRCGFESECRFSHNREELSRYDCQRFILGGCPLRERCPLRHDAARRAETPCPSYLVGACWFGNNCHRCHDDTILRRLRPDALRFEMCWGSGENPIANSEKDLGVYKFETEDQCPICFEELADELVETDECHHLFHRKCITEWLVRRPTCPLCRSITSIPVIRTPF